MDAEARAEARIVELELRYMQQQELLLQLSDALYQQQRALELVTAQLMSLQQKVQAEPGLVDGTTQERPPHY